MTIWLVIAEADDGDVITETIIEAYDTEALAREHADRVGSAHVTYCEVLTALSPDAIDTRAERAEQARRMAAATNRLLVENAVAILKEAIPSSESVSQALQVVEHAVADLTAK